jgi:hypothetical protein
VTSRRGGEKSSLNIGFKTGARLSGEGASRYNNLSRQKEKRGLESGGARCALLVAVLQVSLKELLGWLGPKARPGGSCVRELKRGVVARSGKIKASAPQLWKL